MDRRAWKGIICAACAAVIYGLIPLLSSELTRAENTTIPGAMMYRFAGCALIHFLLSRPRRGTLSITKRQFRDILLFGSFAMVITNFMLVSSYRYTGIGMATICHFFYPVAVCIIMHLLFREQFDRYKIFAVLFTLASLLLLAYVSGSGSLFGMGIAVLSGIGWAAYLIGFEKASYSSLDRTVILSYLLPGAAVFYFLFALLTGGLFIPTGIQRILIALCAVGVYLATAFTTEAVSLLSSSTVAFISLFEPVTSVIADYLYYHTVPHGIQWPGYAMMLAAIIFVTLSETEKAKAH